jgi:uncharacterized membrane protein
MKRWEDSITIAAPASKIYAFVSDFTKHSEWGGHSLQATKVGDGPVAVGTKYATTAKLLGTQREESTITDMSSPSTFAWDSVGALGKVHHWFALSEQGGSTTVTKGAEFVTPKFLAKMTMFKISKDIPAGLRSDLANIKSKMEA